MFYKKLSRFIINKRCMIRRYTSYSSGDDKDTNGCSSDSTDKNRNDFTNLQIPFYCAYDNHDNPSSPTMYDSRKYGYNLPCDSVALNFETLPYIPTGVFRCTYGEILGRGAYKGGPYQNPEYFSFHHMTFYDMHLALRGYRQPCSVTGRKP